MKELVYTVPGHMWFDYYSNSSSPNRQEIVTKATILAKSRGYTHVYLQDEQGNHLDTFKV